MMAEIFMEMKVFRWRKDEEFLKISISQDFKKSMKLMFKSEKHDNARTSLIKLLLNV